ncbi:unnamed protein product [Microthlaspi erraticum]|uniref:Uncharacterized protein n=1 Tax=Microthlaspi erraticum TaxID=1685480 RepID=A0A6D2KKI9_9BRAS|nr:unnamed protein product [Microthlaspi erraticum]
MDFIKTSSLRALIELTFQRNWNGLIWMSRKGVTTKRVKTVQTALSRISAQTAQSGWPRERMFPLGQITSVRLKSRPKFKPSGRSRITTRETMSRGRPRHNRSRHAAHDHAREPGSKPRGRATFSRTTADAPSEPGSYVPRPAENSSANLHRPTTAADHESVRPRPFRLGHDPISGRSSRPSQRRGRPEARFEARFTIFKPGLTLSRL